MDIFGIRYEELLNKTKILPGDTFEVIRSAERHLSRKITGKRYIAAINATKPIIQTYTRKNVGKKRINRRKLLPVAVLQKSADWREQRI